jgi:hypothetical protein
MITPSQLTILVHQLRESSETQSAALIAIAELLDIWSESLRTGAPALLASDEAREFVRSVVVEYIDRDPSRPIAATAIWVLGKLYDKSLESYLADLAMVFAQDDQLTPHLHQTVIALDNLEVLPSFQLTGLPDNASVLRQVTADYLARRTH